jgi:hypothetical protein
MRAMGGSHRSQVKARRAGNGRALVKRRNEGVRYVIEPSVVAVRTI